MSKAHDIVGLRKHGCPNNGFDLTPRPVTLCALIMLHKARQATRRRSSQCWDDSLRSRKRWSNKVCATNACIIPYYLVAIKIRECN